MAECHFTLPRLHKHLVEILPSQNMICGERIFLIFFLAYTAFKSGTISQFFNLKFSQNLFLKKNGITISI